MNSSTPLEFSLGQIRNLVHRSTLTSKVHSIAQTHKGAIAKCRIAASRHREFYLTDNANGVGQTLEVRNVEYNSLADVKGMPGFITAPKPEAKPKEIVILEDRESVFEDLNNTSAFAREFYETMGHDESEDDELAAAIAFSLDSKMETIHEPELQDQSFPIHIFSSSPQAPFSKFFQPSGGSGFHSVPGQGPSNDISNFLQFSDDEEDVKEVQPTRKEFLEDKIIVGTAEKSNANEVFILSSSDGEPEAETATDKAKDIEATKVAIAKTSHPELDNVNEKPIPDLSGGASNIVVLDDSDEIFESTTNKYSVNEVGPDNELVADELAAQSKVCEAPPLVPEAPSLINEPNEVPFKLPVNHETVAEDAKTDSGSSKVEEITVISSDDEIEEVKSSMRQEESSFDFFMEKVLHKPNLASLPFSDPIPKVVTPAQIPNADTVESLHTELDYLSKLQRRQKAAISEPTEQISMEIQSLLRLFGVPFITAPLEAEATCAYLDYSKQVDAVVTDDSDVFLFGNRTA
jgi:XPG I-region